MRESQHCQETVFVRDQYRYSGRCPACFSMHYRQQHCRRFVKAGEQYCWQHRKADDPDRNSEEE